MTSGVNNNKEVNTVDVLKAVGIGAIALGGAYLAYKHFTKEKDITVREINIYPVKALAGMSVEQWPIGERGFVYDRHFMVVTDNNTTDTTAQYKFISQRQLPRMCRIAAKIEDLNAPKLTLLSLDDSTKSFVVDFKEEMQKDCRVTAEVWKSAFTTLDMGDQVANWLSDMLGKQVRLVMVPDDMNRTPELDHSDLMESSERNELCTQTSFADGYPYLIVTENSLGDVNKRLPKPVKNNRFRPNITIKYNSTLKPFEEEYWKHIEIVSKKHSNVTLYHAKVCTRCSVPNINPDTAQREEKGPSYQLVQYHNTTDPLFGINVMHTKEDIGKVIAVGDTLKIQSKYSQPPV